MKTEKLSDISIFLIVYAVSIIYFILKTYDQPSLFGATLAFTIMAAVSLLATLHSKADEDYYRNVTAEGLIFIFVAVVGMIAISSFFVGFVGRSVLYFPTVFTTLATVGGASSIFTSLLGEMVYQFCAVATGEELLKLAAYSELKYRYKSLVLAVGLAVGFWAGFHALQAYSNVFYVIPAFACGLVLIALLEYTKSFIATILAHGAYNTITIILNYSPSNMPITVPWFPTALTSEDLLLIGLAAMWTAFIILPILVRRR